MAGLGCRNTALSAQRSPANLVPHGLGIALLVGSGLRATGLFGDIERRFRGRRGVPRSVFLAATARTTTDEHIVATLCTEPVLFQEGFVDRDSRLCALGSGNRNHEDIT